MDPSQIFGPWRDRTHLPARDLHATLNEWHPDPVLEQIEASRARLLLTGLVQLPAVPMEKAYSPGRKRPGSNTRVDELTSHPSTCASEIAAAAFTAVTC